MKNRSLIAVIALAVAFCTIASAAIADKVETKEDQVARLNRATEALRSLVDAPDRGIPKSVLDHAKCIAVVPNLTKAGFVIAGKIGKGVSTCRLPNGTWSAPAFFSITGGSWGAQIGIEDVHLVMVIMNDEGMRHLLNNKFQVGGDASAAAGPIGREASAGTDWKADTEILTYSRAKGLYAGIDLSGSWIERDRASTISFYGQDRTNRDLLAGEVKPPSEAQPFLDEIERLNPAAKG